MRILAAVQAIFAIAFTLVGLLALFGIGITGLFFLVPGVVFAATAGVVADESRAGAAAALGVDAVLAWFAARKLMVLIGVGTSGSGRDNSVTVLGPPDLLDYLFPGAALLLVGIAVLSVTIDWRT
ncbi:MULTISPECIES: hypothetical protein [unclassified Massilia]|uniref:hypothetical protein n=1 Tax=unclassified Massilia TaxID=2609279 RepID=UPI0017820E3A|nr:MULTISPECIES: hypothetical protein [unclassified Massilia]MBD8528396.1 hypothetical protein [Massilia sp. CFBP 13647]MBD8671982.1 hypothetical protein [Massilia sp. CFBP 13721]